MDRDHLNDINPYTIKCSYVNKDNCPPPGSLYEKRRVKWYELELILWGEGYIITEGKKLPASKGDLFFRHPGMEVQGVCPYYCYLVVFDILDRRSLYADPDCYNSSDMDNSPYEKFASEHFPDYDFPDVINLHQSPRFEILFRNIYEAYINNGRKNQFFLKTYLMQILMDAYMEWTRVKALQNPSRSKLLNYSKVMSVKKHIEANFTSRIKLDELAQIAGVSPNFLCKAFKDITNVNVIEFVNECRVNLAKKDLIETNKTIKEISFDCGFANDTYFYTIFKKKESISPAEYREKHRLNILIYGFT